jgi:hypothetical protein
MSYGGGWQAPGPRSENCHLLGSLVPTDQRANAANAAWTALCNLEKLHGLLVVPLSRLLEGSIGALCSAAVALRHRRRE